MSNDKKTTSPLSQDEIFYTTFEPKTMSRFICRMTNKEGKTIVPPYLIKEITRPSVFRTNKQWIWNPIQITTYDPIVPSATQIFYDYLMQDCPEKFDIVVDVLGPVGDVVEKWEIKSAEISKVDFGVLDWCNEPSENGKSKIETHNLVYYYKGSQPVEIKATIIYDFARLVY